MSTWRWLCPIFTNFQVCDKNEKKQNPFKPQRYRLTKTASFTNHINTVHSGLKRNDIKTLKKLFKEGGFQKDFTVIKSA